MNIQTEGLHDCHCNDYTIPKYCQCCKQVSVLSLKYRDGPVDWPSNFVYFLTCCHFPKYNLCGNILKFVKRTLV